MDSIQSVTRSLSRRTTLHKSSPAAVGASFDAGRLPMATVGPERMVFDKAVLEHMQKATDKHETPAKEKHVRCTFLHHFCFFSNLKRYYKLHLTCLYLFSCNSGIFQGSRRHFILEWCISSSSSGRPCGLLEVLLHASQNPSRRPS